ncbi:pseudaminic acid biosynthesis-associated methylase [Portibacter lacus]|uniref:Methyltransferase type 11 domain-containing protein n=1 Tax=Portibacter lacus TaxID=1099794 RepID=A0AA37WHI7_9BACT|nr:pseudaminic acid biosynthesis-associated methylase [Portibacter lacus]GLR18855.1 hypothetical protein GCM10007940_34710 [Portibacter lacus]
MKTEQIDFWAGEFGEKYTERNSYDDKGWDEFYRKNWGTTKPLMNEEFLGHLSKDIKILEVGSNTGMQLNGLQRNGFTELYGVELQRYAVERSKDFTKNINLIQGSGFDLPFKDEFFDVTCTNGVLIHIAPKDLPKIMGEMYRTSKKYIWGFEYFEEQITDINYRGNTGYLWKADYAKIFMEQFPDLKLVKKKMYPYVSEAEKGNVDCMYLLEKS